MLLYIIRHGEAEAPKAKGGTAREERHLTPDGKHWVAEVVSLAKSELGFNPDQILSSPLARAKETAEIVHRTLGAANGPFGVSASCSG